MGSSITMLDYRRVSGETTLSHWDYRTFSWLPRTELTGCVPVQPCRFPPSDLSGDGWDVGAAMDI